MTTTRKRTIAIYLPQYHRTPENDRNWGNGFTEWINAAKAHPRFPGHYQPHVPSDLGFYDLRVPEALEEHARYARRYGIDGFCFYHYWFSGRKMLAMPIEQMLANRRVDIPFMLCWANGNWSCSWTGRDDKVLFKQEYSDDDDKAHIRYLIPFFQDPRYIRIDHKPVIAIYRSESFPDIERTLSIWRAEAGRVGLELYICRMESLGKEGQKYMHGFDAGIEFQPHDHNGYAHRYEWLYYVIQSRVQSVFHYNLSWPLLFSYKRYIRHQKKRTFPDNYVYFPCVTPMWDNSARKGRLSFFAFVGSTPRLYKEWLMSVYRRFTPPSTDENLVFINAWNEWAEGNHLEPDQRWGRQYLEATREAVDQCND